MAAVAIADRLSRYLGVALDVRLESAEEMAYGLLMESLPEYAYGNILDLSPLTERGMLILDAPLCMAFVDRVLGGACNAGAAPRALTAVDQTAAEITIEMVLRCLRDAWKEVYPLKLNVIEKRADARQVTLAPPAEPVLNVTLLVTGDIGEHRIRLCMPVGSLKNVATGAVQRPVVKPGPEQAGTMRANILRALEKAPLRLVATIGSTELSVATLVQLKAGDIVRLDNGAEDAVVVEVAGQPAFVGKMGLRGRKKAVQVTGRIDTLED